MLTRVYMPGCWDLLHVGHLRALKAAAALADDLIVGVASDEVIEKDKGRLPIIPLAQRLEMLQALNCVSLTAPYYELEFIEHLERFRPDVFAVGSTWGNEQRHRDAEDWCVDNGKRIEVIPYTKQVSSTLIKSHICKSST